MRTYHGGGAHNYGRETDWKTTAAGSGKWYLATVVLIKLAVDLFPYKEHGIEVRVLRLNSCLAVRIIVCKAALHPHIHGANRCLSRVPAS
jgi:hypothetical protein